MNANNNVSIYKPVECLRKNQDKNEANHAWQYQLRALPLYYVQMELHRALKIVYKELI